MTSPKAVIVGLEGPELTAAEAAMLQAHPPAGAILFARNIVDPAQLGRLTAALRQTLPEGAVLLVDQEGGRVARLRPPHWRAHPPAAALGDVFAADPVRGRRAAWLTGALIGTEAAEAGFDVVCAPVLDLRIPGADAVIGDRAFAADPLAVAELGRAVALGLLAAGVQPVGKHAPGHGRARVDSHLALPEVEGVDLDVDLLPFTANTDVLWLMTAHILYPALDEDRPATLSPRILSEVVRGRIGFRGVLVSDDLAMHALSGTPAERALAALAAGCDLALYCQGDLEPTRDLLERCPPLTEGAAERLATARLTATRHLVPLDAPAMDNERNGLLRC
jgi:beta-N-acetylhexosaminidase